MRAPSSERGESEPPLSAEPFGRYRLIELIARGGMAEVFKAKSFGVEGFEKILVIKQIVPELATKQTFVDMFIQEAKLAVQLSHANIVQVFDLGRVDGDPPRYYIAMEYVDGVDLSTLLEHHRKRKESVPIGLAIYVASEVSKALDHAHRRLGPDGEPASIVHRDISPHNVLLSWHGDVKVTDFGIAKAADALASQRGEPDDETRAPRATGKLSFMSPEQSRSERTDPRSDLFSLGIVLYQLLAGANPFSAPTEGETVRRIQAGEFPPLALARPDVPDALVAIVDDLLKVAPDDRVAHAGELHERLVAFAYETDARFTAADLAAHLVPLRSPHGSEDSDPGDDIPAESVLEEPGLDDDKTPVEVPHAPANGSTPAPPPPLEEATASSGERREVTLLVLDLGDTLAGDLDRKAGRMQDLLESHGGWLEEKGKKHLMAVFGLGDTDGRDAEAAVRAAMVLVRERRDGGVPSAGIHSGPINVDDGGIPKRDERMLNVMATAQRLARVSEGQVVVSPITARLVRRNFLTEPLPDSLRAISDGGHVVRHPISEGRQRGRFVGRTAELKRLGGILAAATRRDPQLVVLRGETGLGKTRLLDEARRRLERGKFNVAFHSANCPLNGASVPWSGLRAMLHGLCGTQEDDDAARILEVRPRLRALGLTEDQAGQVLQLLGVRIRRMSNDTRHTLRESFATMIRSLSRDRLHCFAWDDAHAIDRETLETILRIVRKHRRSEDSPRARGLRAVFLLSQRGELPPALARRRDVHVLNLGELEPRHVSRLLESILGARMIPQDLLELVLTAAGGHPLFIDELVRELLESGSIESLNGKVRLVDDSVAVTPRTLRTLIAARVSRLQQRERRVLQGLAVLGEPAFSPMLSTIVDLSLPNLDRHLTRLDDRGLVRRTGPTQVRFASPLFQEIVLDAMTPTARQELHGRAADAYAEATLPGAGEAASRIADHLVGAGQRHEAVEFFWRAARERVEAEQLESACRAMMRALALADIGDRSVPEILEWLEQIATVVSRVRKSPGLEGALAEPLRQVETRGDAGQRAMSQIFAARAFGAVNLFDQAYAALDAADTDHEDDDLLRERLMAEIAVSANQGKLQRATCAAQQLEPLAKNHPGAQMMRVLALSLSGSGAEAEALLSELEDADPPGDTIATLARQKQWLHVHFHQQAWERARATARDMARLARGAGLRFEQAAALHNLADIHDRLGEPARAYAEFQESLELSRLLDHERLSQLNRMHLCLLQGLRGDEEASHQLERLVREADAFGYVSDALEGRLLLGRLLLAQGHADDAQRLLQGVAGGAEEARQHLIGFDANALLETL